MPEKSAKLIFNAAVIQLDAKSREATFYIMNASKNRNRWGVTAEAMAEGAPSIKNKTIGSGPDYKIDKHYPADQRMELGTFKSYDIPSTYMVATATITDEGAWSRLESKEFGPISVVVTAYAASCSQCGGEIIEESYEHDHVKNDKAWIQVTSFKFDAIDFVDDPAYPQAGLMDMGARSQDQAPALQLAAAYYDGSDSMAPGSQNPEEKRKRQIMDELEHLKNEAKTKDNTISELQAQVKTLEDEKADSDELISELNKLKAEKHQAIVDSCAQARFEAGLVEDLEKEKSRLKEFDEATLAMLSEDAAKFKGKIKARRTPKAGETHDDTDLTELETAFEAARVRLGLPAKGGAN